MQIIKQKNNQKQSKTNERNKNKIDGTFYVIKGDGCSLLSYQIADELSLIKIVHSISPPQMSLTVADELVNSHTELLDGIGKLKDVHLSHYMTMP